MSLTVPAEAGATQAGNLLLDCAKKPYSRPYTELELGWIDQAITQGRNSESFDYYIVETVKAALDQQRKNFELVQILLRKQTSESLFEHSPDILCLALKNLNHYKDKDCNDHRGVLTSVIKALLDRGAEVNYRTERGQTALLHCCWNGSADAYHTLLNAGADFTTIHKLKTEHESQRVASVTANLENNSHYQHGSFNLLHVVLSRWVKGEHYGDESFTWTYPLDKNWGLIITDLLEKGLEIEADNSMLIKFFYVAIMQGRIDLIKILLARGVPLEGVAERRDDREQFLGSALQAATSSGQEHVVRLLLEHGANPRALTKFGGSRCYDGTAPVLRTAIDAALLFRMTYGHGHTTEQLQACMVLLETSSDPSDGLLLLKACVNARHLELTKRLLEKGLRIERYPIERCWFDAKDEDIKLIELLERYDIPLDIGTIQLQAAENGQLKLLWMLVNSAGPQIPHGELRGAVSAATANMPCRLSLLKYLILEYGLKVNAVFPGYDHTHSQTMLGKAVEWNNTEAVRFLLKQGADIMLPGSKRSILSKLKKGPGRFGTIEEEEVPIIRLLTEAQFPDLTQEQRSATDMWTLLQVCNTATSEFWNDNRQEQIERIKKPYTAFYSPVLAPTYSHGSGKPHLNCCGSMTGVHQYETLQGLKPIRLLIVERAWDRTQMLSCSLSTVGVFEAAAFEILSYCDASQATDWVNILLNGKLVSISRGLQEALMNLRRPNQERMLWVEELCIDATSDLDKTQQRRLVSDIFARAEQTICWLGESTKDIDELFDYLLEWRTDRLKKSNSPRYPDLTGGRETTFQTLIARPWFWSTWRVVELALSKKPILMCGRSFADWSEIGSAAGNWQTGPHGIWQSLLGIHEKYWWWCLDTLKKQRKLSSIFEIISLTQALDARDKVFAIQIIADLPNLSIDYGMSTKQIYQNFTEAIIKESNRLEILHWLGSSRKKLHNLPSWVLDYSICKPTSVLPRSFSLSQTKGRQEPPRSSLPRIIDNGLHTTGKRISRVKSVGREMTLSTEHSENVRHLWDVIHDWEALVASDLPESKWHGSIKRFLEALSAEGLCVVEWYRTFCLGLLEKLDPLSIKEHDDFMAVEEWAGTRSSKRVLSDFTDCVRSVCPGRRLVILENGMMGLAHPDVRERDQLVGLAGALYPFIIRPTGNTTFKLIGDCYLSEFDNDDLSKHEDIAVEDFCLR